LDGDDHGDAEETKLENAAGEGDVLVGLDVVWGPPRFTLQTLSRRSAHTLLRHLTKWHG
jgi:hypothetical protein